MDGRLKDKAIIVVGAGTKGEGIGNGKAAAIRFAQEGAKVLCVDCDEAAAKSTRDTIRDEGGRAEIFVADIVEEADCERVVNACLKHFNKLEVLHNNVGIALGAEIIDTAEEDWDTTFDVNVKGMWLMCKYAIPPMIDGGGGSIINVSSIFSIRPGPPAPYSVSKGAVDTLTRCIAYRYARYNIRANALQPGGIDTPMIRPFMENEQLRETTRKRIPMRRYGSPWEVANVAVFLASDEASYVTGITMLVDGGLSLS